MYPEFIPLHSYDSTNKISIQVNVVTDKGVSQNDIFHWTNDEIGVSVESWFLVQVELMGLLGQTFWKSERNSVVVGWNATQDNFLYLLQWWIHQNEIWNWTNYGTGVGLQSCIWVWINSWSDRLFGRSIWIEFNGCGSKFYSVQLSIATSQNSSMVNTICILSSFHCIHIHMILFLSLKLTFTYLFLITKSQLTSTSQESSRKTKIQNGL